MNFIPIEPRDLVWMAQTIHQAYHDRGSWDTCKKSFCTFVVTKLLKAERDLNAMHEWPSYTPIIAWPSYLTNGSPNLPETLA